jgi:hypothetical protein
MHPALNTALIYIEFSAMVSLALLLLTPQLESGSNCPIVVLATVQLWRIMHVAQPSPTPLITSELEPGQLNRAKAYL